MSNEIIYERQIKPLIEEISKICMAHEIPMFATFQDAPQGFRTTCLNADKSLKEKLTLMYQLDQSWSIDEFLKLVIEDAKHKGHQSLFLTAMGIPQKPEK